MSFAEVYLAVQLARVEAESALPTAPVVGGRLEPQAQPVRVVRTATAKALRFAADRISPSTQPVCG
jgi:hypothetical protein